MSPLPELVVILAASLETNALGRALSLANLLPESIEVEVWGPKTKHYWSTHPTIPIRGMDQRSLRKYRSKVNLRIAQRQKVVFWASKCYPFAARAVKGLNPRAIVIADFDDHDVALAKEFRAQRLRNRLILNPLREGSPERVSRAQRAFLAAADAVTVSSFSLAKEMGIRRSTARIPHARPSLTSSIGHRPPPNTIGFLGTMRAHKGYAEIRVALESHPTLTCVTFRQESFNAHMEERWKFLDPATPISEAYAQIELAVLPMSDSQGAQFQLPAKAIDAAAASVPIVATPTPVLTEYFGESLLHVSDWSTLGAKLEKWREDGTLQRHGESLHRIWLEMLSLEHVREEILALFATLAKD